MSIRDDQLKKIELADMSHFDKETNTYYIPKYSKPTYAVGGYYLVSLDVNFVNNTTSAHAVNWNHGTAPKDAYMKIYVSKVMGKMIYVDSLSYNMETHSDGANMWSGWLNINDIKQLAVI